MQRDDEAPTTFVPMSAVEEGGKGIARPETKSFAAVRKGHTYFSEGDVLFAKITPCMQNGKHAVARDLIDGIGFGSTEFHVLRPSPDVTPEWLHYFVIQPHILHDAKAHLTGAVGQQRLPESFLANIEIPVPPLPEQQRTAAILGEQMAAVERARDAAQAQLRLLQDLTNTYLRQSLDEHKPVELPLSQGLIEVSRGVGSGWHNYRVIGATRAGLAPAKEQVGKSPERYKFVDVDTIFYNPMRILIGSIAMIDEGDEPGITSPDYVVLKTQQGILHPRWFYYWLRSPYGENFIRTLARGAVRERMLFRRLASADIQAPPWDVQAKIAEKLRSIPMLQRAIGDQLEAIDDLPYMMLQQAFNGEL